VQQFIKKKKEGKRYNVLLSTINSLNRTVTFIVFKHVKRVHKLPQVLSLFLNEKDLLKYAEMNFNFHFADSSETSASELTHALVFIHVLQTI